MLSIPKTLQQGIAAQKEGRLQEAEGLYRSILQSQPLHPDANHNLGVLAVSANNTEAALSFFKAALEANPRIDQFWLSYIDALIADQQFEAAGQIIKQAKKRGVKGKAFSVLKRQLGRHVKAGSVRRLKPTQAELDNLLSHYQDGRLSEAEKSAKILTRKFSNHQLPWKVLGAVMQHAGKFSEAAIANQKAVELSTQDAEAHNNLGNALKALGRLDKAEASYIKALALNPRFAEAHGNLGITLQQMGRLNEAEASYTRAIALKPGWVEALNNLGSVLRELGRLEDAESSYKKAIALMPGFAEAHNNLGAIYNELGKLREAEASYSEAITLNPRYAVAHANLGTTLQDSGRFDEATASYSKAIRYKPDYADAHRRLSMLKRFSSKDEQYAKMQALYLDTNISDEERCHINFGLAKAFEDLQDYERAFSHYLQGNALRKKLLGYDFSQDVTLFRQLKMGYRHIVKHSLTPHVSEGHYKPIFIVGMPRSGTTLLEQIISAHSQVTAAGELPYVAQFGAPVVRDPSAINQNTLRKFRDNYLSMLRDRSRGNRIVTDKMPQNFCFIGLLTSAFPEAKIIHIRRDPAAVCWSNFKQYFGPNALGYCYALDDVVSYYKLYEDLMEFWDRVLTDSIYTVDYEKLVVDQEEQTRKLIRYIGLEWEDKCLSPHENNSGVATASNLQVRQGIYQGSSQQWKKYEAMLNGAFDQLQGS